MRGRGMDVPGKISDFIILLGPCIMELNVSLNSEAKLTLFMTQPTL
jgi:hypothetical protein